MTGKRSLLLVAICGGMLLSWVYAWACFIMPIMKAKPFSMTDGALILALATAITMITARRGWRMISILVLQAVGFIYAVLRFFYVQSMLPNAFWGRDWAVSFLERERDPLEWMATVMFLFWALLLWIGGVRLGRKSPDQMTIGSRFDLGLSAFFLLLLIRLVILAKGGETVPVVGTESTFIAFIVFGLLAMGLARRGDRAGQGSIVTYRSIGVLLSFVFFVILLGGGLVLLFLPHLTTAADTSYDLIKRITTPLGPVIVNILRFILIRGCRMAPQRSDYHETEQEKADFQIEEDPGGGFLDTVVFWVFLITAGVLGIILLGFTGWYLIRWLFSRRSGKKEPWGFWDMIYRGLVFLKSLLLYLPGRMKSGFQYQQGIQYLYGQLLNWGTRSGLGRSPNETPLEYGSRLISQFPGLTGDIGTIIDLFDRGVYGNHMPDGRQLQTAHSALRRLRSPFVWPARMKTWLLSPYP